MGKNNALTGDVAGANLLGRRLHLVVVSILTVCYLLQSTKNSISIGGLLILLVTLWVPVLIAFGLYKKDPASTYVKHVMGIGYGCFYVAVGLISDQQLVFTYAFPMLLVVTLYCDLKFSVLISTCVNVIAIVHAIIFTGRAGWSAVAIAAMEIEIAATILVCIYSTICNKFVISMMDKHLKAAKDAGDKSEGMLTNVLEVSTSLTDEIQLVSDKMETLATASNESYQAMQEVQQGANDTAEAVQSQLLKTEEIQNQIDKVTETAENIQKNVEASILAIKEGNQNVQKLMENAKASEEAGKEVATEVEALKNYTNQMESIVSLIQDIASQTSLLSLNASIEAARAGEAGKGFAVVAGEISSLSAQTPDATENLAKLIKNVTTNMDGVANAITTLVESNKIQNASANVTADSFNRIAQSTDRIEGKSVELTGIVESLDTANKEIVDSIQVISAISEEVSASATTTLEISGKNEEAVDDVKTVVIELSKNSEKLKNI